MTPLERRCRRVVRLLPPAERAARGEEVLGVLLDLSAGRDRPPPAEAAAVAALALNLRMRDRARRFNAPVLVAALVVVTAPWLAVALTVALTRRLPLDAVTGTDLAPLVVPLSVLVLWLGCGAGWLLGYRRAAVAVWVVLAGVCVVDGATAATRSELGTAGPHTSLDTPALPVLLTAVALVVAAWRGVPEPPPFGFWVWLLLGVGVAWLVAHMVVLPSGTNPVAVVAAGLAGVLVVTGRGRGAGAVPGVAVAVLTVAGLVPVWLGLVVVTAAVGMSFEDQPSTSLVT